MIHDILENFGSYLTTSAGYKNVFYNKLPEKGWNQYLPLAEIYVETTDYPLQSNMGATASVRSSVVFKSYFDSAFDNGSLEAMKFKSQKETGINAMLYSVNFLKALPNANNDFISISEVTPVSTNHISLIGDSRPIILIDYRLVIDWRFV